MNSPQGGKLRAALGLLRRTPLHPQWLLSQRKVPTSLHEASGMLLDIGAADRWILPHLPRHIAYIALDYPATGRDRYGARPDVFADAAYLPFADESFDNVVCLEVLEHVRYPERVITEIGRVLKPGGKVWLSMPFLYPVHDAPFDFQRHTAHGLQRDMERAGLSVTKIERTTSAVATAGLLFSLAIAGGTHAQAGVRKWLLLPPGAFLVTLINLAAWLLAHLWPGWDAISEGHTVEGYKG